MVSIKDIAKECGVSAATVSKALNDQPDIGKVTKDLVRKTAAKLGYVVNPSARALKTNRTYNIGIVYSGIKPGLAHEYFSVILESFKSSVEAKGYDITFVNNDVAGRKGSFLEQCRYRQFDGVAVITADFTDPEIKSLCESGIPAVTIDYVYSSCSSVVSENVKGMRELTDYVISKGHKDIAFIHGEDTEVTRNRIMGFTSAMRDNGLEVNEKFLLSSAYHDADSCYLITRSLLKEEHRPSCIMFPDDYSYMGGLRAIIEAGLNIPTDISTVGYDDIGLAKAFRLTTYNQDSVTIGRLAGEKLIKEIENPESYKEHSVVIGKIVERWTVRDIREQRQE